MLSFAVYASMRVLCARKASTTKQPLVSVMLSNGCNRYVMTNGFQADVYGDPPGQSHTSSCAASLQHPGDVAHCLQTGVSPHCS